MNQAIRATLKNETSATLERLGVHWDAMAVGYADQERDSLKLSVRSGQRVIAEILPMGRIQDAQNRQEAISVIAFGLLNGEIQDRMYSGEPL